MSDDETLGRPIEHGADRLCGRGLVQNLPPGVGRYAHLLVETEDAPGPAHGPVIMRGSANDKVGGQQGLRRPMVQHGLVEKWQSLKGQGLKLRDVLAESGVADI